MTHSLNNSSKFTIIFSAQQATCDELTNLINNAKLADYLDNEAHVEYCHSVGVYKGECEQSFVVHTNSSRVVANIRTHVCYQYKQECILVSRNREHIIDLYYANGAAYKCGNTFNHHATKPSGDADYTVLNGTDYYTVY